MTSPTCAHPHCRQAVNCCEEFARLSAPIGLDLGALTPEETALSIMGEIVAHRRGREGGRLSHLRGGRIHEVTA